MRRIKSKTSHTSKAAVAEQTIAMGHLFFFGLIKRPKRISIKMKVEGRKPINRKRTL